MKTAVAEVNRVHSILLLKASAVIKYVTVDLAIFVTRLVFVFENLCAGSSSDLILIF